MAQGINLGTQDSPAQCLYLPRLENKAGPSILIWYITNVSMASKLHVHTKLFVDGIYYF